MKRAFTLIELLVVIAIIAILAALLMPALEKARASAKQAKCAGNLHNVGLGISMFRGDHGQRWIAGPQSWFFNYPPCELQAFVMKDYVQDWSVWACPSFNGQGKRTPGIALKNTWWPSIGNNADGTSYLTQSYNCWENPPTAGQQGTNTYSWAGCVDICYFYDEADVPDNPDPSRCIAADGIAMYDWRGAQPADHKEGSNALFVDNAVSWIAISSPTVRWSLTTALAAFGGSRTGGMAPTNAGPWIRYGYIENPRLDEDGAILAGTSNAGPPPNPGTKDVDSIYDREGTPHQWGPPTVTDPGGPGALLNLGFYEQGPQARNVSNNGLPPPSKTDCAVGGGQCMPSWWSLPFYRGDYFAPAGNTDVSLSGWQWGVVPADEANVYQ
jgi:prepilin-type N-terminal cleavage/methylation domain-containing protein